VIGYPSGQDGKTSTTESEAVQLGEWKERTDERFGVKRPKELINAGPWRPLFLQPRKC